MGHELTRGARNAGIRYAAVSILIPDFLIGAHARLHADRLLTRDLIAACEPIGIKVLDHLIVTEQGHFSFADSGLLDELKLQVIG